MSLSADERRALDTIQNGLAESYPSLAEKLTTFARLAADEGMPGHEKVSPCEPQVMTPQHRVYRRYNLASRLLLWLALAVAVIAASGIGVAVSHGAGRPCTDSFALMCSERANPNPNPSRPAGPGAVHGEGAGRRGSMHGL